MTNLDKVHLCYINPKRIQITLFQNVIQTKPPPQLRTSPFKKHSNLYRNKHSISTHHHMKTVLFIKFSYSLPLSEKP